MKRELLLSGLEQIGQNITEKQIEQFQIYSDLLVEWNQKMNLTAITEADEITIKHFLDSILLFNAIEIAENARMIDIGTGAGFPGIPVKIMREDISLTLMDSLQKRIRFLQEVGSQIFLQKTEYIHARAEEAGRLSDYRQQYDIAVSRAVADMEILCEYCLPFVKVGGIFAALKSYGSSEETERAKPMIGNLGGEIQEIKNINLPNTEIIRSFVIIKKKRETPPQFPRNAKKINKKRG
uniref:Ribosomal RNA small subunit methyltransferase G n=1 Tax=uncultured Bacillota bacterium TaxID=344338 RepID=A0A650EPF7_9FIRM|nr:ribosomal RNA small subunit methyltransferase G [uncultured Firmicutes bacterium]